jgi:hypothetical protein
MSKVAIQGNASGTGTFTISALFSYRDGDLYWSDLANQKVRGKLAGSVNEKGYRKIEVNGKKYGAHQIVFALHHGYIPDCLDHINGIKDDNRIENLRPATKSQNGYNRAGFSDSKNVTYRKDSKSWRGMMQVDGKCRSFGSYKDKELAELVAHEARIKHHGEFANHV